MLNEPSTPKSAPVIPSQEETSPTWETETWQQDRKPMAGVMRKHSSVHPDVTREGMQRRKHASTQELAELNRDQSFPTWKHQQIRDQDFLQGTIVQTHPDRIIPERTCGDEKSKIKLRIQLEAGRWFLWVATAKRRPWASQCCVYIVEPLWLQWFVCGVTWPSLSLLNW